jgi:hypothetical protein
MVDDKWNVAGENGPSISHVATRQTPSCVSFLGSAMTQSQRHESPTQVLCCTVQSVDRG